MGKNKVSVLKVLVPIKRVIDYNMKIRVKADGSGVDVDNVKMSMNPFDEIAVEEALRIKEAGNADEVVLVSIGISKAEETLRMGLAMGADRGILVQTNESIEPLAVSKILKTIVKNESIDLVIMGKQAIDDDCNQTGQMLAGLLGWGQGTFASEIVLQENTLDVTREVDGGLQTLKLQLPAVVTTDLRLNTPRYPKLPNVMKAKKKPIDFQSIENYNLDTRQRLEVLSVVEPPKRSAGVMVQSVSELVQKLKVEAKVL